MLVVTGLINGPDYAAVRMCSEINVTTAIHTYIQQIVTVVWFDYRLKTI